MKYRAVLTAFHILNSILTSQWKFVDDPFGKLSCVRHYGHLARKNDTTEHRVKDFPFRYFSSLQHGFGCWIYKILNSVNFQLSSLRSKLRSWNLLEPDDMMEHLSDKHQTSSMSGISMISGANSMPCPTLTNFSLKHSSQLNLQQGLNSPYHSLTKNNNQLTKINQALTECKGTIAEFVIKKLILDCLSEVTSADNPTLKKELDKKLKQIMVFQDADKYVHLPNNFDSTNCKLTLLGITDFSKIELHSNEKSDIRCTVEKAIERRTCGIISRYKELSGNLQELQPKEGPLINHHVSTNCFDMNLLQWREKLEQLCEDYERNVSKYNTLMREWIDLKYEYFNNLQFKKAESLLINIQVSEARAKIAKLNGILKMYQETPVTLTAYRLMDSNLNAKIAEMKEEINRKGMSKTLYDQLKGTEYDEVVDKYRRLRNGIEKKKFILRNM